MEPFDSAERNSLSYRLLNHLTSAVVLIDVQGTVQFWNESAERLFKTNSTAAQGKIFLDLIATIDPTCQLPELKAAIDSMSDPANINDAEASFTQFAGCLKIVDGTCLRIDLIFRKISWRQQTEILLEIRDVGRQFEREAELEHAATTDSLSQLLNRRGFQQRLESCVHECLSLTIIDIDWFKRINDEFGHETGDQAICFVAEKLKNDFPDSICVARLGGDEFGVILKSSNAEKVQLRFEILRQEIATTPFSSHNINLTISVGIAYSHQPFSSARELLTIADQAMYQSKKSGRNRVSICPVDLL